MGIAERPVIDLYREYVDTLGMTPVSCKNYVDTAGRFVDYLDHTFQTGKRACDMENVKGYMVQEFVKSLSGKKDTTRRTYFVLLGKFTAYLANADFTAKDLGAAFPVIRIRAAEEDEIDDETGQSTRVYGAEQIMSMMASGKGKYLGGARNNAIIVLLSLTGLRASEASSLNVGDIRNCHNGIIKCRRKGGKVARVAIPDAVFPYIEKYLASRPDAKDDEPLFLSTYGNRMTRHAFYVCMSRVEKECGLRTGVHNFRHTFTTNVAQTAGIYAAMALDNHHSEHMTRHYTHLSDQDRLDAVNNNGMAAIFAEKTESKI